MIVRAEQKILGLPVRNEALHPGQEVAFSSFLHMLTGKGRSVNVQARDDGKAVVLVGPIGKGGLYSEYFEVPSVGKVNKPLGLLSGTVVIKGGQRLP